MNTVRNNAAQLNQYVPLGDGVKKYLLVRHHLGSAKPNGSFQTMGYGEGS